MKAKRNLQETSPEHSSINKKASVEFPSKMAVGNMSIEQLKVLLDECLIPKFKEVATKKEVLAVSNDIQLLRAQNVHLLNRINNMESYCQTLERQLEILSRKENENSVVVHFPAEGKPNKVDFAKQTCIGLLQLQGNAELPIEHTQEFTNRNTNKTTVILKFQPGDTANKIIEATPQLKNSGIVVHREQSIITRQKRTALYQIKTKLIQMAPAEKILIRGVKLNIRNFSFSYNFSRGLVVNNSDELTFIKNTFGEDALQLFDTNNTNNCQNYAMLAPVVPRGERSSQLNQHQHQHQS